MELRYENTIKFQKDEINFLIDDEVAVVFAKITNICEKSNTNTIDNHISLIFETQSLHITESDDFTKFKKVLSFIEEKINNGEWKLNN